MLFLWKYVSLFFVIVTIFRILNPRVKIRHYLEKRQQLTFYWHSSKYLLKQVLWQLNYSLLLPPQRPTFSITRLNKNLTMMDGSCFWKFSKNMPVFAFLTSFALSLLSSCFLCQHHQFEFGIFSNRMNVHVLGKNINFLCLPWSFGGSFCWWMLYEEQHVWPWQKKLTTVSYS